GVGDAGVEAVASEHDEHAVLGLRNEHDLHALDVDVPSQLVDDDRRLVVGYAPGSAVTDVAGAVEGGQVGAGGDVARLELDVEAGRRQGAPPQLVLEGVVAEQPE